MAIMAMGRLYESLALKLTRWGEAALVCSDQYSTDVVNINFYRNASDSI